jgi:hypothetical protein
MLPKFFRSAGRWISGCFGRVLNWIQRISRRSRPAPEPQEPPSATTELQPPSEPVPEPPAPEPERTFSPLPSDWVEIKDDDDRTPSVESPVLDNGT